MDLEKSWKDLGGDAKLPESWLRGGRWHSPSGLNPLARLKRNLRINMTWGMLIAVLFLVAAVVSTSWVVQLAMGIMFAWTTWGTYGSWKLIGALRPEICHDCSLVGELQRQHDLIRRWMRSQEKTALFLYPVAVTGGFLLGGLSSSGLSLPQLMAKTPIQVGLVISIVVLTPLSWLLARWMNQKAFGTHLDALKANIQSLTTEP
jgi:hypothetical protein